MKPHYILTSHGPLLAGVKRSAADVADIAQKRILVEQRRAEEDRRLADYANTLTPSARAHLQTDLVIAKALEFRTHMPKAAHQSVASFLRTLEKENITLAEWSRRNNLDMQAVYTVCSGRALGRRGKTRQVMAAMGLPLPPMHKNDLRTGQASAAGAAA